LGASHQTGWTGIIGRLIQMLGSLAAQDVLTGDMAALLAYEEK
jgi:hypothetical protein